MNKNQQNEIQLRSILNVVFKRKNQTLIFFGATIFTVIIATFLVTPQFEASTQILVTLGRGGLLFANMGDKAPQVFLDQENVINSEVEILKSVAIAEKVIKELGGGASIFPEISKDRKSKKSKKNGQSSEQMNTAESNEELNEALLIFKKSPRLQVLKKSNLINVSYRHPDPKLATEILNKLTSIYVDHHAALRKTKKSYEFFQNQTELLKDKTIASGKELESFKRDYEISDFDEQKASSSGSIRIYSLP